MNQTDTLIGIIDRFLFQNAENGFAVFILTHPNKTSTTVRGYVHAVQPGEQVSLEGTWTMHPKFGKQFEATKCTSSLPTSVVGLQKYLGSGLIKGIGPVYAKKMVDYFGAQILEIIDKTPDRLREIPGVGEKKVSTIISAWQNQKEISHIMVFLQEKGVTPSYATKIFKKYGSQAIAIVTENPYRLAEDIWGIGFKTADQIAQQMGFEKNSLKRIKAGILFAITDTIGKGHLYAELAALKTTTCELLELNQEEITAKITNALHELYNADTIKLISHENLHYVTLSLYYFSEKGVAQKIEKLQKYPSITRFNLSEVYTTLRTAPAHKSVVLNEEQQKGIMACLQHKVTIITGGPGTGKTTLIRSLLGVLDEAKVQYRLAAPTGRAAKRMQEGTGRYATTLHRLLEFDFTTMQFTRNESNALVTDFLIVDEASMLDIFLAYAILKATPLHAHILLIGDVDQLPSVGAGNVLNDLIASNIIPSIRLQHIFRQAQDSLIITNAHRINNGEFPISSAPNAKKDFIFIKEDNPEQVTHHLRTIFGSWLGRCHIAATDTMVLVPMNRGVVGTQKLNYDLQTMLNSQAQPKELTYAGTAYKIGDRVMQIRNNYDKNVFNGDIGIIDEINLEDRLMTVRYDERLVEYESGELDEIVLAYAVSIHKSQGSEYSAAIIPIFMQHFTLLQRNLIYTAVTRAKKLCILIGQPKAIAMAIKNNKGIKRITFLQHYLTSDLQCR